LTERTNKTAIMVLRNMIIADQTMWPDLLPDMLQKMRCHVNKTTGYSPYEMMFGRIPKQIAKINQRAMEIAEKARLKQKFRYDKKHKRVDLEIGDLVLWWWDKPLEKNISCGT
jgi:hypothetical protein